MKEISGRKFAAIAIVSTYCFTIIGSLILTIMRIMEIALFIATISGLGTITIYIIKAYFDDKERSLEVKPNEEVKK